MNFQHVPVLRFCLVAYAFHDELHDEDIAKIRQGYFPYVQGLHILLDYFIDQEEDRIGGDLNFCSYYENEQVILDRMKHFVEEAERALVICLMRSFIVS